MRLLLWFSTSPNLIAAYLDGVDVCQGGSTETTDTTIEMPDEPQGPAGAVFKVFKQQIINKLKGKLLSV